MHIERATKIVVQCDFDGTITEQDVSFMLLEKFADGNWRELHKQYEEAKISVGGFNREAFAMVRASRESLVGVAKSWVRIRAGFPEMVDCCRQKGFRFVIVSNGLDFYIDEILRDVGLADIEVFAAQTHFYPEGLKVQYIGPDGSEVDEAFKDAYARLFLSEGYRVIYMGNGTSDLRPAKQCHHIFATGSLLKHCQQEKVNCTSFTDFRQVISVLSSL